jgi:hypothetical protein
VSSSSRPAGFSWQNGHHGPEPDPVEACAASAPWLSNDRIDQTRRVWSQAYGRVISREEAIEILLNVRRFAEVLLHAGEELKP